MTQSTDDLVKRLYAICRGGDGNYAIRRDAGLGAESIERLQRELDETQVTLVTERGKHAEFQRKLLARAAALDAARDKTTETLREDAERYRWLKSQPMTDGWALVSLEIMDINEDGPTGVFYSHDGADLDAAIDAARSEVKQK